MLTTCTTITTVVLTGCGIAGPSAPDDKFAGCYDNSCVDAPMLVSAAPPLASLSAGTSHTCGLTAAGEAWCWGDNTLGALGEGSDALRTGPVQVSGALRFASIAAGRHVTCGITLDQAAYCWGLASGGQIAQLVPDRCGTSGALCARQPLRIGTMRATAIAAGTRHVCALDTSGTAYCWGFNFLGETGGSDFGTTTFVPRRVTAAEPFVAIGAGDSYTCARTAAGRVSCWGSAGRGELGRAGVSCTSVLAGVTNLCSPTPAPVNSAVSFASVSVGNSHSCAIASSAEVLCWGDNGQGQLGTGEYRNADTPVRAFGGKTFVAIAASGGATCGTPVTGPTVCWGLNQWGKLGIGQRLDLSPTPRETAGGRRFVTIAASENHLCALTADGATYCWGLGAQGQLGAGPRTR